MVSYAWFDMACLMHLTTFSAPWLCFDGFFYLLQPREYCKQKFVAASVDFEVTSINFCHLRMHIVTLSNGI